MSRCSVDHDERGSRVHADGELLKGFVEVARHQISRRGSTDLIGKSVNEAPVRPNLRSPKLLQIAGDRRLGDFMSGGPECLDDVPLPGHSSFMKDPNEIPP